MKILLHALSYARHLWPYYTGIVVTSILTAGAGLAIPFVIKEATDLVVAAVNGGQASVDRAIMLAVLLLAFDVAVAVLRNVGGYLGDMMAAQLRTQLSVRYYQHLLALPQSYFDNELTGTIINRLNRVISELTQFLNIFANNFFQMILTAIFTIGIVTYYSWQLGLLLIAIYPLFGWLTTRTSKKWQRLQNEKNDEIDTASGRFGEIISQIKVTKSYAQEALELGGFSKRFLRTIGLTAEQSRYWHNMDVARSSVLAVLFFGMYFVLFTGTVQGDFSVGEMILLITLLNNVRQPISLLSFIVDQYQRAVTGSREFVTVMRTEPAIADRPDAAELTVKGGEIAFSDVTFSYDDAPVLKGISFAVKPGQKLALVGESGEGKTTITNLLMRFYEPTGGRITIDGTDIGSVTQVSLRRNIATVFQDPALFSGTIRENIAYGRPDATDEEVIAAAKAASADQFIAKLKDGYDSVVGERGVKLSGGQKQRVSIARALLKDSPILILDEATSSLDSRSEHLVQTALERLMKGRTTIIIAHRLSTISGVDTIVTLKGGRVNEVGTPKKLATSGGIYAGLLALQAGLDPSAKEKLKEFGLSGEN